MFKRFIQLSLVLFFVQSSLVLFADTNNFMWKVSSGKNEIHLLGSIHAVKKEMYPLNKKIISAFNSSDVLAVEADISKMDMALQQKLLMTGMYQGTDTLKSKLSLTNYAALLKKMEGSGLPEVSINKMKPWMIVMMMSQLDMLKVGASPELGIDMFFIKKATAKKLPIAELEGIDFQLKMFETLSDKMPNQLIHFSLKDSDQIVEQFDILSTAWKNGDAAKMTTMFAEMEDDKQAKPVIDIIMHQRNKTMTAMVKKYIKSGKKYFVVVGAGHLVGKTGIVAQLRKQGFKVEQVKK